jgi:hypothetical protein
MGEPVTTQLLIDEGLQFLASLETPSADDWKYWGPLLQWIDSAWRECFSGRPTREKICLARMCGILESVLYNLPTDVEKLTRYRRLGKGNSRSLAERQARTAQWQPLIDAMSLKNPRMTYRNLADRVGRTLGVSGSTVRRHCRNPRPKI